MTVATAQDLIGGNNNTVGIKVSFGREIRRASLSPSSSSFSHLRELVGELFSLDKENLALKYKDEDGDLITISLDREVDEAIKLAQANKTPLHLVVEVNLNAEPAPKTVEVKVEPSQTQDPSLAFASLGLHHSLPPPSSSLPPPSFPLYPPLSSPLPPTPSSLPPSSLLPPTSLPLPSLVPSPVSPFSATTTTTTTTTTSHPVENDGERERRGGGRGGRCERGEKEKDGRKGGRRRDEENNNNNEENDHGRGGRRGGRGGRGGRRGRDERDGQAALAPMEREEGLKEVKEEKKDKEEWREKKREMREALRAVKESGDRQALQEFRAKMREDKKRFKTEKPAREGERQKKYKKRKDLKMKIINEIPLQPASPLPPNSQATKTWRIKNVGGVEWPAGSQLLLMSRTGETGPAGLLQNGGQAVKVGEEVDLSVTFAASATSGSYFAKYSLVTPDGDAFGKKVVVFFSVAVTVNDQMQLLH